MASARTDIAKTIYQQLAGQGVLQQAHWRIERKISNDGPWRPSVTFQLRLTYSALEFYVSECRRITQRDRAQDQPFEAMRLVFDDGISSTVVDGVLGWGRQTFTSQSLQSSVSSAKALV
jgi:hypothetical protein